MKKRLLMVLGAGASIECGMPKVAAIDALMATWAREAASLYAGVDYYGQIWAALEPHLAQGPSANRATRTFERALGDLAALMHWARPAPEGGVLRALAGADLEQRGLQRAGAKPYELYIHVKTQLCALMAALARYMRRQSATLDAAPAQLAQWRALLEALRARFDVAIYTLNYDDVALRCWPGVFTGFDAAGAFDAASVHERGWEGLFHLHGSVHFTLDGAGRDRVVWREGLSGEFADSDDRVAVAASDGRDFPPTSLIAGGFKLDQLLLEPFNTYQSTLVRDAARADAILVGGYGFGDAHVNRALRNALQGRPVRPPVLVLDCAGEDAALLAYRQDRWSVDLQRALYTSGDHRPEAARLGPCARAARGACEMTPHRVAIWHGGFLHAAPRAPRFTAWLEAGGEGDLGEA